MLQEDDVLPSQRGRRLKGEGKGIERNAKREERPSRFSSSNQPPFLSALHAKNDTTYLLGYKLGESTENNKALLFLSGKETVQTFNGYI